MSELIEVVAAIAGTTTNFRYQAEGQVAAQISHDGDGSSLTFADQPGVRLFPDGTTRPVLWVGWADAQMMTRRPA